VGLRLILDAYAPLSVAAMVPVSPFVVHGGQEGPPEHVVLGVADAEAEHLPAAVSGDPGRHHHRLDTT
jgi:hypothetical protein